jgi:hypothetical protein
VKRPDTLVDLMRTIHEVTATTAAELIDEPFIDWLISEFELPDRDQLVEAINMAAAAYEGHRWLDPRLRQWRQLVAELFDSGGRALGLIRELGRSCPEEFGAPARDAAASLNELLRALAASVGQPVDLPPKRRGRPPMTELRTMVEILADYWVYKLDREWTQDRNWIRGEGGGRNRQPRPPGSPMPLSNFWCRERGAISKRSRAKFTGIG